MWRCVCVRGVYATKTIYWILCCCWKLNTKAIKMAATFPLNETKRFQLLFLYFQNRNEWQKKWATMRQPLPLLPSLFTCFFEIFVWNEMQPNKLSLLMERNIDTRTQMIANFNQFWLFYSIEVRVWKLYMPTATIEPTSNHFLHAFVIRWEI